MPAACSYTTSWDTSECKSDQAATGSGSEPKIVERAQLHGQIAILNGVAVDDQRQSVADVLA